mmetsp:Transcript_46556/g.91920  ORF Transcript_46556/g.91920 Transcript_46556/m.91920 type:complete len:207 (-) Transcript_46556:386-1006(-)
MWCGFLCLRERTYSSRMSMDSHPGRFRRRLRSPSFCQQARQFKGSRSGRVSILPLHICLRSLLRCSLFLLPPRTWRGKVRETGIGPVGCRLMPGEIFSAFWGTLRENQKRGKGLTVLHLQQQQWIPLPLLPLLLLLLLLPPPLCGPSSSFSSSASPPAEPLRPPQYLRWLLPPPSPPSPQPSSFSSAWEKQAPSPSPQLGASRCHR